MKRMLALLMVLILLSSASLGFAEETKTDWKELLSAAVDSLREDVEEASEKAAEIITEKAGELSETVSGALTEATGKVEEYSDQAATVLGNAQALAPIAVEMGKTAVIGKVKEWSEQISDTLENAKTALPQYVEVVQDTAGETLDQLSEQLADILADTKESVTPYVEQAGDTVSEKLKELSEQVSGILESVKNTADQVQGAAVQKAGELAENAGDIAQAAKEKILNALNSTWKSAIDELKALVDWLKGGDQPAVPVIPQIPAVITPDLSTNGTTAQEAAAPQVFYPMPGYGFYFGMPWKEAKALNANWLNDSRANTYARARALVMLNQQGTSLYFLWFAGETEDAPLFEVDEFAFTAQDTLVPPQGINGQYSFITTDAAVKQVYAEKELSCGQRFGSPSSLESGLLVSSLMFHENDKGISQAQVYLLQNQENVIIATHFVYTTDCGVNVIIYQYM